VILADTQAVAWLTLDRRELSQTALVTFAEAHTSGSGVGIASTTLWELAMMATRGIIKPRGSTLDYLRVIEKRFVVYPITGEIAERSMRFTDCYPKDPADRIIGATALVHNLRLVTADKPIRKSGEVPCIW